MSKSNFLNSKKKLITDSIVNKENVYGCQFHPEKSSTQGLNIIKDFINL